MSILNESNKHHHMLYAVEFPNVAYKRMRSNGKTFVYDNRSAYDGQLPIARIRDHGAQYDLIYEHEVVYTGTLKNCLQYTNDMLLKRV